jgi:hypothetical protein
MCSETVVCLRLPLWRHIEGATFAFVEDLDIAGGQARLDLGAGDAIRAEY